MGLLIIGAGGHGRVVKEAAISMGKIEYKDISFLDDNNYAAIGKLEEYKNFVRDFQYAFVAIGNPIIREDWIRKLVEAGYSISTIIHPSAYVAPSATVGQGSVVLPSAIIQTNATIGEGVIVSSGAIIDHDVTIGNYSHINAGAVVSSGTTVQEKTKVDYLRVI